MKTIYLLSPLLLWGSICFAQNLSEPSLIPGMFAIKISPNGKWVGSQGGYAALYNTETNELTSYSGGYLGMGNTIADNGMAVGDGEGGGCIMWNGSFIYPESLNSNNIYYSPNAITKDATRMAGIVRNPQDGKVEYVPFVADMDSEGNVNTPILLPYPEIDLFGAYPYQVTAQCLSDDGKTAIGMVVDWRGIYSYPILYFQDEKGIWDYLLPTENLFNPDGIEIPKNPWLDEPPYPYPQNFMTGAKKDAYEEEYKNWVAGFGTQPEPQNYMTEEQYTAYEKAVEVYNDWYYSKEEKIKEYIKIYDRILSTSPTFSISEISMHPSGEYFLAHGGVINDQNRMEGKVFEFLRNGEIYKIMSFEEENLFPSQVLTNGTIVLSLPLETGVSSTYFLLPGETEPISVGEYLKPDYPGYATWLEKTAPYGNGFVIASDDLSVIASGLMSDNIVDFGSVASSYRFYSYVISDLEPTGIEEINADSLNGVYNVYNLQGVKVMQTKDISKLGELGKGLYIINGKKVIL